MKKHKQPLIASSSNAYVPPRVELFAIDTSLSLLESLSLEGNVSDFIDDGELELEDYYPIIH